MVGVWVWGLRRKGERGGGRTWGLGFFGFGSGVEQVRQRGFEGVVGAEDVDVYDAFEGVAGELGYGGEEIACCAGAVVGVSMLFSFPFRFGILLIGKGLVVVMRHTDMTKSIRPSSSTHLATAAPRLS